MFQYHLKIAFRQIRKQKLFSLINILSLSLGITSAFIIYLYIQNEMSYDEFHHHKDRIVRLTSWYSPDNKSSNHFARIPGAWQPWMDAFKEEHPEIETIARLTRRAGTVLQLGENRFSEKFFFNTDEEFFNVFSVNMVEGNAATALEDPHSVIISESMSTKYFNSKALGETLFVIDLQGNKTPYKINGVMNDWPENSHMHINFLASHKEEDLSREWAYTYLLLKENIDVQQLEDKFHDFILNHWGEQAANHSAYYLQRLTDIHLNSHIDRELKVNGNINTIRILGLVIIFIIAIACVNYMNLTIASAIKRIKEIGVRRAIGSTKQQVINQLLTETIIIICIATFISILFIVLYLPVLNHMTGKAIAIQFTPVLIGQFIGLILLIGFIAGVYPAIIISRLKPINALRSQIQIASNSGRKMTIRNILVTLQFCISLFLLISTLVLKSQLNYIHQKPLGLNKEQVINIGGDIPQTTRAQYQVFRNQLIHHDGVMNISACMQKPFYEIKDMGDCFVESVHEGNERAYLYILPIDENFFDLMEIEMHSGQNFSASNISYSSMTFTHNENFVKEINETPRQYIINEAALKNIGFESADQALGKNMDWNNSMLNLQRGPIIGVVKDFHFTTLHKQIKPYVLIWGPRFLGSVLVKIKPENMSETIQDIEKKWNQMFPESPFEYHFIDELFEELYTNEKKLNQIITWFTFIAIIIGCMGLFGLVLHSTERRTKEIGIRKVVGASILNIIGMLSKDYLKWVCLANLIVWPLAWYATHQWLQNFAYHIQLTIWPFLISGIFILIIAFLTICWQSVKSANVNPVKSLRYE